MHNSFDSFVVWSH